jgi:PAS domain S-box-containing protein
MVSGITRDITDRKLMEDMLRDSENKYRTLAETTIAPIMIAQGDKFIEVNTAAEFMTGYSKDELLSMSYLDLIHPDFKELVKKYSYARQKGAYIPPYENKFVKKNGEIWWGLASGGHTIYKGNPVGVVTYQDITDYKRSLEELKKSQAILTKAQSIANIGIFCWDVESKTLSLSEEDYKILGYGQDRPVLTFEDILNTVHPDDKSVFEKSVRDAVENFTPFHFDYRIVRPDGSERILHTKGEFSFDESGKPYMMIGVNQDITDQKCLAKK